MKKQWMKTFLAVTLSGAMTAGVAMPAAAAEPDTSLSGKLVIWEGTSERGVCAEAQIAVLKEMYPNIDFSYEAKPENTYFTALSTAFQSGNGPDIFWTCGTKNAVFEGQVEAGNALPLTDLVDMSLFEKDGEPTMISEICYVDDVLYAVPTSSIDTRTVYYNADLFKDNGYEVPTTVAEFEALCDTMLEDGIVPLTLAGMDWASIMHTWDFMVCTQAGGPDFFTRLGEGTAAFNEEVNVNTLQKMVDWKNKGYFSISSVANDATAACMEFATGSTGMIICGSWMLSTIRNANANLNFDVFKLANDEDGKVYACITANGGYSINPNTKNLEAAKMFAQWMTTVEGQQTYINSNASIPALEETPSSDEVSTKIGMADVLLAANEEKVFLLGAKAEEYFEANIMSVFSGSLDAQEFCDNVQANID